MKPSFQGGIDGGTMRRIRFIEFTHVVPEAERDPDLVERILAEESDLLLGEIVRAAIAVLDCGDANDPRSSDRQLEEWALEHDPVRRWAEERIEITLAIDKISLARLHEDFVDWCHEEGIREPHINSRPLFGRRLQQIEPDLIKYRNNGVWFRNVKLIGR